MLERKIDYYSKTHIKTNVCNITECPIHFHSDDLEIVVVLKGAIKIIVGYRTLLLKEGEVFIFNDYELHGIYSVDGDNKLLVVHINIPYFRKYNPKVYTSFFLMAATYLNDERYDMPLDQLKEKLFRIAKAELLQNESDENFENLGKDVFAFLLDNFQYFFFTTAGGRHFINRHERKDNQGQADRIRELMVYIWDNCDRKITLQEYAEETNINMYYLSHIIKDSTGLNFQELLNFSRVERAERILLETNRKISEISLECGFSATRYFVKHFEKWFQNDPNQYREKHMKRVVAKTSEIILDAAEAMEAIEPFLTQRHIGPAKKSYFYTDVIEVDAKRQVKRRKTSFPQIIEWNQAAYGRGAFTEEINELKKRFEFCIRINSGGDFNERAASFIEGCSRSALLICCGSAADDTAEGKRLLDGFAAFCERIGRKQICVYAEYDSAVDSETKADFCKRLAACGCDTGCRVTVREMTNKKTDYYRDSYIMDSMYIVPWIIKNAVKMNKDQKFINSVFDSYDGTERTIKGDRGIVTVGFIRKPSFYAYKFLSRLGDEVIENSEGYIVTRRGHDIQLMFYDCDMNIFDNIREYSEASKLSMLQVANQKNKDYKVELNSLEGRYAVTELKIGKDICLFRKIFDLGMPERLTEEEEGLLRECMTPTVDFYMIDSKKGFADIDINVPRYGATFVSLRKIFE